MDKRARLVVIGGLVALSLVLAWRYGELLSFAALKEHRADLLAWREAHFAGLAAVFFLTYVGIVAFSVPGAAVASVTGGFLFGLWGGTALNVTAATVGAALIFLAARWGFGARLAARMETSDGLVKRLKARLKESEWSVLFLLRLVPVVPFFVANLLPALVGVSFARFVITTFLGIIPGGLVFTWIGVGVGEVFDRGESPDLSLLWEPQVIGPILGLCALALLPMGIKAIRGRGV